MRSCMPVYPGAPPPPPGSGCCSVSQAEGAELTSAPVPSTAGLTATLPGTSLAARSHCPALIAYKDRSAC